MSGSFGLSGTAVPGNGGASKRTKSAGIFGCCAGGAPSDSDSDTDDSETEGDWRDQPRVGTGMGMGMVVSDSPGRPTPARTTTIPPARSTDRQHARPQRKTDKQVLQAGQVYLPATVEDVNAESLTFEHYRYAQMDYAEVGRGGNQPVYASPDEHRNAQHGRAHPVYKGTPGSTPHPVYARYEVVDGVDGEQPDYVIPPPVTAAGLVAYQDADTVAHVPNAAAGTRYASAPPAVQLTAAGSQKKYSIANAAPEQDYSNLPKHSPHVARPRSDSYINGLMAKEVIHQGVLRSQGHGLTSGQRIPPTDDTKSKQPRKLPAQPPPSTSLGTRDKNKNGVESRVTSSRVTPTRSASVLPATAGAAKPTVCVASVAAWKPGTDYDVAPMAKVIGTAAALPAAALEGWAAGEEDYDVGASTETPMGNPDELMITAAALERRRIAGIGKMKNDGDLSHGAASDPVPTLPRKLGPTALTERQDSFRGFDTVSPLKVVPLPVASAEPEDEPEDDYGTAVHAPLFANNPLSPKVVPPNAPIVDRVPTVIKATRNAPKPKLAKPPAPTFVLQRPPTTKRPSRPVAAEPLMPLAAHAAPARGKFGEPVYVVPTEDEVVYQDGDVDSDDAVYGTADAADVSTPSSTLPRPKREFKPVAAMGGADVDTLLTPAAAVAAALNDASLAAAWQPGDDYDVSADVGLANPGARELLAAWKPGEDDYDVGAGQFDAPLGVASRTDEVSR